MEVRKPHAVNLTETASICYLEGFRVYIEAGAG